MKKFLACNVLLLLLVLAFSSISFGQCVNVTATITDANGQVFMNGAYTWAFTPPYGVPGPYIFNGTVFPQSYTGALSSSGTAIVCLTPTTSGVNGNGIVPAGGTWVLTACPNASVTCTTFTPTQVPNGLPVGVNYNAPAITFSAGSNAYGYNDTEVAPIPLPGGSYFNVISNTTRTWTGLGWISEVFNPLSPGPIGTSMPNVGIFTTVSDATTKEIQVGGNIAALERLDGTGIIRQIDLYYNSSVGDFCVATNVGSWEWAIVTLGSQTGSPGGLINIHSGNYTCAGNLLYDYDWITTDGLVKPHWNCCGSPWPTHDTPGTPGGAHVTWTGASNGVVIGNTSANMHGDYRHHSPAIKRMYLDGNYTANWSFYDANLTDEEEVSDNTMVGWVGGCIFTEADSHWLENNNCQNNPGQGIQDNGVAAHIAGNIIYDNGGTAITAQGGAPLGPIITGNWIGDVPQGMYLAGTGGVVSGNAFNASSGNPVIWAQYSAAGAWQIYGNWNDNYNGGSPLSYFYQSQVSGDNAAAMFVNSSTARMSYQPIIAAYAPNAAISSIISSFRFGHDWSYYNGCNLGFNLYAGAGNNGNFAYVGCWGSPDNIRFPVDGSSIIVPSATIQLDGVASYAGNITRNTLTAARTWNFPNITGTVALTPGNQAWGTATLVSGTVTVSNTTACTISSTCLYRLSSCGAAGSVLGARLDIGTIVPGTSFVIHALSTANAVVTTDVSTVCWQIN